jgi:2-(1,2-epoxy-1,2-dihydrophenyl)acetyl-CoA isomerase
MPAMDWDLHTAHETVNLHRAGPAAKIELNRPDSLNSWNTQLSADLWAAFEQVRDDDDVRAVLVTGAGRAFCSGADLKDMQARDLVTEDDHPDLQRSLRERYHPVLTGLRRLPKPVVSAVNGPCVGVGLSLALAADLVYCAPSAYFLLAFVNIGLVPDGGSSAFVPARIGAARAAEMAMLGERVGAERALEWGLVNSVIDADAFASEVDAIVEKLAHGPTLSYAGSKRQLNAWAYERLDEQLELEAALQQEMAGTHDFAEGVIAFLEKRSARFTGR